MPGSVEEELHGYLECGILSFGFARARCTGCGTGFVVAFSCKGRGVCPSCNSRHMAQTAAHLADHVIPPVPVELLSRVVYVGSESGGVLQDSVGEYFSFENKNDLVMAVESSPAAAS